MKNTTHIATLLPCGFECKLIEVESDITRGLPGLHIVGLGNRAVTEAKERLRSSINNSGLTFPPKRVTINLAPAEIPKDGTIFDLPMAISILQSNHKLNNLNLSDCIFAGELSLDGSLRPIRGAISIAESAEKMGFKRLFLPLKNLDQAKIFSKIEVIGAKNLEEIFLHLIGAEDLHLKYPKNSPERLVNDRIGTEGSISESPIMISDIIGQTQAKRALQIAAAGRHSLLLSGPPGTGKTMLAKALLSLLPQPNKTEMIDITKMQALTGVAIEKLVTNRPFRSPHHSASATAILGGGVKNLPGEVSLANRGVLFLDELLEFSRPVIEALRQPLENKQITISRADYKQTYPADFLLIATTNPCPCGYFGDVKIECKCNPYAIKQYQSKLSGPILDRFDLEVQMNRSPSMELNDKNTLSINQQNEYINEIKNAFNIQNNRYKSCQKFNNSLNLKMINNIIQIDIAAKSLLNCYSDKLNVSTRSYLKIIRVAQTIADLDASQTIQVQHMAEALQFRPKHFQ